MAMTPPRKFWASVLVCLVVISAIQLLNMVDNTETIDDLAKRKPCVADDSPLSTGPVFELPQSLCTQQGCCPIRERLQSLDLYEDLCSLEGPGGCYSGPICRGPTCLNRLPLPCSLPYLAAGNSSLRTSYSTTPVKKALLTMAVGDFYGPEFVTTFFGSLRRTGYDGLVTVVVDRLATGLVAALYDALDVEQMVIDLQSYPTKILTAIRFLAYEQYLVAHRSRLEDALIFHCDSRDIYFQRDPFEFEWPPAMFGYPSSKGLRNGTITPKFYPYTGAQRFRLVLP